MPDLPELPNDQKTDLDTKWEALRDELRLGDEELATYDGARDAHACGLAEHTKPSVELAKRWFIYAAGYYWNHWRSDGDSNRVTFARWITDLKNEILAKLDAMFQGRSDVVDTWFDSACRPVVDKVLCDLVNERIEYSYSQPVPRLVPSGLRMADHPAADGELSRDESHESAARQETIVSNEGEMNTLERILAFMSRLEDAGAKITKTDMWKTYAGYKDSTEFERFQRDDPRTTRSAKRVFNKMLELTPQEFADSLKRKKSAKTAK